MAPGVANKREGAVINDPGRPAGGRTSRPCAKCGKTRQAGGYRMFRYGVGYCDGCAGGEATWILGPGWTRFSPGVIEGFAPGGSGAPHTNHA